jgi:TetR/AcrR family transcriptional repressor of nem operon
VIGRPRQFDEIETLERAMQVFWDRGYEAAGMSELLQAMQISRQSCYNTFGEKRELFLRAMKHYGDTALTSVCAQMSKPGSPLGNVRGFLEGNASCACKPGARGCMVVNSIVEFGADDPEVSKILRRMVTRLEGAIEKALVAAKEIGEISDSADPKQLSKFVTHVAFGFAALGKIKMCKESSSSIVDVALNALDAA